MADTGEILRLRVRGLPRSELDKVLRETLDHRSDARLVVRDRGFLPELSEAEYELIIEILKPAARALGQIIVDAIRKRKGEATVEGSDDKAGVEGKTP